MGDDEHDAAVAAQRIAPDLTLPATRPLPPQPRTTMAPSDAAPESMRLPDGAALITRESVRIGGWTVYVVDSVDPREQPFVLQR